MVFSYTHGSAPGRRRSIEINRRLTRHMPEPAFSFYAFLVEVDKQQDTAAVLDEILRWDPGFLLAV